eukprot:m.109453 g.109453  ORF g.109453 m.109453 type:complete len:141 (+) comp15343_c0_seq5:100-522(+)
MDSNPDVPGFGHDAALLTEAHALTAEQLFSALSQRGVDMTAISHEPDAGKAKAAALQLYQKHVMPQPKRAPRVRRRRVSRKRSGEDIEDLDMDIAATHISIGGKKFKDKATISKSSGLVPTDAQVQAQKAAFEAQAVSWP